MDTEGAEGARTAIEAASPTHPSLIDVAHVMGERFGVVNIPNGVWIDETGRIVRPAEPAWPNDGTAGGRMQLPDDAPDRIRQIGEQAAQINVDRGLYSEALRDWAKNGSSSRFVLSPDEVVARSQPRDPSVASAAAHFELAQHLHSAGQRDAAISHFRESHRLQPDNWTYRRQAWELASRVGGPLDRFWQGPPPGAEDDWPYEGDWVRDIKDSGPENYYPAFVP